MTAKEVSVAMDHSAIGIHGFVFGPLEGMEVINSTCRTSTASVRGVGGGGNGRRGKNHPSFLQLLIHLWPGEWKEQLCKLNVDIEKENNEQVS